MSEKLLPVVDVQYQLVSSLDFTGLQVVFSDSTSNNRQ